MRQEPRLNALLQAAQRTRDKLVDRILRSTSWQLTRPLLRGIKRGYSRMRDSLYPRNQNVPHDSDIAKRARELPTCDTLRKQLSLFLSENGQINFQVHSKPEISVILVLHNKAELTFGCLHSLQHCAGTNGPKLEVVILDNGSWDQTGELLTKISGAKIIQSSSNLHFLRGVNNATSKATGQNILLLNNDTVLHPGALEAALSTLNSADDIGAVGGRIVQMDGCLQEAGSIVWNDGSCVGYGRGDDPNAYQYLFRRDVDYCSGVFLLTRRYLFEKLNKLDDSFAPAYYEETDYCMRLWRDGYRVLYEPDVIVFHFEFGSAASRGQVLNLQRKNQQLFYSKHQHEVVHHYRAGQKNLLAARSHGVDRSRILVIDDRVPYRGLGSGYPRCNDIIKGLVDLGYLVTMYPLMFPTSELFDLYEDIPKEVELVGKSGVENLEEFLVGRGGFYHKIFVSRPHNMSVFNKIFDRHRSVFEGTEIIYDAEALFSLRDAIKLKLVGKAVRETQLKAMVDREISIAHNANRIVTVSEAEAHEYRKRGYDSVAVVGHRVIPAPTSAAFERRRGILFVGAIHAYDSPNADSVSWFAREVWPLLRHQLPPETEFLVAGINKSGRISQLNGNGTRICGFMENLTELYDRSRIFVSPTRYAAGLPHKVHEAAAYGLPIVGTSLIARQLGASNGGAILVADTPQQFVQAAAKLYTDEALWMKTRQLGIAMVERDCSATHFKDSLIDALGTKLRT